MKNKDLVVYKNEFNTVALRNFTSTEMDLLMAIMSQMKDEGLTEVEFSFEALKELSKYNKANALDLFTGDLRSTYNKLISLNVSFENKQKLISFVLFTKYEIDKEAQTVKVRVNEEFQGLINEMTGSFTKFELQQFTELKSSYSKTAYRFLKQYRATGTARFNLDEFRRLLDIPDSYKISDIDKRVLRPIQNELSSIFKDLEIIKHKKKRSVVALEFKFRKEEKPKKELIDSDGCEYESDLTTLGKNAYGEFENVFLSQEDIDALLKIYDVNTINDYIERLSTYIQSTGRGYVDHRAAILNWIITDENKNIKKSKQKDFTEREYPENFLSDFSEGNWRK